MKKMRVTAPQPRKPPGFQPRPFSHLGAAHSFLFHLTGLDPETDAVGLDHAYAKPWTSYPEASMAKSMVTLFLTPGVRSTNSLTYRKIDGGDTGSNVDLDVETVDPDPTPAYDLPKARSAMKECQVGLAYLRDKEIGDDDWEDKVNKSGWTSSQSRLFNKVVRELVGDKLGRLSISGSDNEPLQLRLLVDKTAKRFRDILATVQWEKKMCSWLHRIIIDHMPTSFLLAYLDVLQALKSKIPTLIDRLLCGTPLPSPVEVRSNPKSPPPTPKSPPPPSPKSPPFSHSLPTGVIDPESLASLLKRPWDPLGGLFVHHRLRKIPANPIILMAPDAPSNLTCATSVKRKKFWHNQLSSLGKVIPINSGVHPSSSGAHTGAAAQSLENMINAMRAKVCDLREHYAPQERPIVLMGWGVGALVCLHVALVETVSAVVCLGVPFLGIGGSRVDVDDPFLDLRTPTLFVLGQLAPLSPLADIEDLREKVKAETSLVVVGGADDQLRMCRKKKKLEGITQSIVDRCVQEEILDFLLGVFTATSKERSSASHHSLTTGINNSGGVSSHPDHPPTSTAIDSHNHGVKSSAAPSPGASKSRKRAHNRDQASSSRVSPVDSTKYSVGGGIPLGASKSVPDIPLPTSDDRDPTTTKLWKSGPSSSMMSSIFSGSASLASASPASTPTPSVSNAKSNASSKAGKATPANGSRGKVKAKKQAGSSKKVSKLSHVPPGLGGFNVAENSKVYGLPQASLAGPTFLNPAMTQQFTAGTASMGSPRTPNSSHSEASIQKVNVQKSSSLVTQNPKPLIINSATLAAMQGGSSSRAPPSSPYIGGASSNQANPLSTHHHLFTMSSSAKQMAPPSLSSLRPSLSGALIPPISAPSSSSTSSFSSSSSSSARLPMTISNESPMSRPKLPIHSGGTTGPINFVRQPVSIKRPAVSQKATPKGKGGELSVEELRRQVQTLPKSVDKLIRAPLPQVRTLLKSSEKMLIRPPFPQAPRASASASSLTRPGDYSPAAHSLHQSKSSPNIGPSQHLVTQTKSSSSHGSTSKSSSIDARPMTAAHSFGKTSCSSPASKNSSDDLPPLMMVRKSVITSAVKRTNSAADGADRQTPAAQEQTPQTQ